MLSPVGDCCVCRVGLGLCWCGVNSVDYASIACNEHLLYVCRGLDCCYLVLCWLVLFTLFSYDSA